MTHKRFRSVVTLALLLAYSCALAPNVKALADEAGKNDADDSAKGHSKQTRQKIKKPREEDGGGYYSFTKPSASSEPAANKDALDDALGSGAASSAPKVKNEPAVDKAPEAPEPPVKKKKSRHDDEGYYGKVPKQSALHRSKQTPEPEPQPVTALAPTAPISYQKKLFMWKGRRDDQTIFLLGTIDVGQKSFYPLPYDVDKSLAESRTLVLESIVNDDKKEDATQLDKSKAAYSPGESLSAHLSTETRGQLQLYFGKMGGSIDEYNSFKPWFVEYDLRESTLRKEGFTPRLSMSHYLSEQAQTAGKTVLPLETPELKANLLNSFPDTNQDVALRLSVQQLSDWRNFVGNATQAWRAGNPTMLEDIATKDARQSSQSLTIYKKNMHAHNAAIADRLEELAKDGGTMFVALDSAKLVGDNGLVAVLQKRGYTLEQMVQTPGSTTRAVRGLKKFPVAQARCTLLLPGEPDVSYSSLPCNNGGNLQATNYVYPEPAGAYYFGYVNYPFPIDAQNSKVTHNLLNSMATAFTVSANMARAKSKDTWMQIAPNSTRKVISQLPVNVQGYEGLDIISQETDKNGAPLYRHQRLVLGDQMIYTLDILGNKPWSDGQGPADFLTSLAITQPGATTANAYANESGTDPMSYVGGELSKLKNGWVDSPAAPHISATEAYLQQRKEEQAQYDATHRAQLFDSSHHFIQSDTPNYENGRLTGYTRYIKRK